MEFGNSTKKYVVITINTEFAIIPKTTAIMPIHCYGKPCDTKAIQGIADKYALSEQDINRVLKFFRR